MKKPTKLAFRGGSYSLLITAIVLAIIIVLNICVSSLPSSYTNYDISASKLYSITGNTKVVVNNLEKDVTVYWIVQSGKEDSIIENLLSKYDSLSDHIDVVKKNPDVYPTFAQQYTNESVSNNSLVVECGDRYRYISYNDIYVQESSLYSYSYSTSFDGEGVITSAIDYVVSDVLPQLYTLQGHGETELPETFAKQIEKENIEVQSLSLLTVDEIPADAACIMIYAPQSDISAEEKTMLADYVSGGGKLLVMAGPVEGAELTNLYSILSDYGVTAVDGIVIESDRNHYAFQRPYILIPDMESSSITDSLIEEKYYPIMPIVLGMNVSSTASGVTTLLSTTSSSFSKAAGYSLSSYDKEEGDTDGAFAAAVMISADNDGEIVWFSSSEFLQDMYNAYSSGANTDLVMNAVSELIGEREAISIRSKSLNYNYLTISESQGSLLKVFMIVVWPAAYLAVGVFIFIETRRKQNAAA